VKQTNSKDELMSLIKGVIQNRSKLGSDEACKETKEPLAQNIMNIHSGSNFIQPQQLPRNEPLLNFHNHYYPQNYNFSQPENTQSLIINPAFNQLLLYNLMMQNQNYITGQPAQVQGNINNYYNTSFLFPTL
jgi:hypothetical protein